jgi:uncharacterized protein YraI
MKRIHSAFALLALMCAALAFAWGNALAQGPCGASWTATYASPPFTTPTATNCLAAVNLNIAADPIGGIPADGWSIDVSSTQVFTGGTYTFSIFSDEAATLSVNNVPVISGTTGAQNATIFVPAGSILVRIVSVDTAGALQLSLTFTLVSSGGTTGGLATLTPGGTAGPSPTVGPTLTPSNTALPAIPPGSITATVIRASVLNARTGPFLGAPVVGRVLKGQTYQIVGRNADATWFLIRLTGRDAWVFGYYVAIFGNEFNAPVVSVGGSRGAVGVQAPAIGITRGGMRLRAAPSADSQQIGRIPWGETIPITARTRDGLWYETSWFGTIGWVYAPFLDIVSGDLNNVPIR